MLLTGEARALMGNLRGAETDLAAATRTDPGNARYLHTLAWLKQLQHQHEEALAILKKARVLDNRSPALPYRMAVSYFFLRKFDDAAQNCGESIRLSPTYDSPHLLMGMIWLERRNLDEAAAALRRAISLRPAVALYHRELGVVLVHGARLKAAKKELERALALDPKAAQTYFWRAKVFAGLGQRQEAIADLESALALQPELGEGYSELARLYAREGLSDKAAAATAKLKELKDMEGVKDREGLLGSLVDPLL